MTDYVTLLGAEDVQRAGHNMRSAADDMRQAASTMQEVFAHHQRVMEDWLTRLEFVLEQQNREEAVDGS